jgi:hypothetical protein
VTPSIAPAAAYDTVSAPAARPAGPRSGPGASASFVKQHRANSKISSLPVNHSSGHQSQGSGDPSADSGHGARQPPRNSVVASAETVMAGLLRSAVTHSMVTALRADPALDLTSCASDLTTIFDLATRPAG